MLRSVRRSYLLKIPNNPEKQAPAASSVIALVFPNNDSEILLWHYCLGHPNFLYLKT